jgi:thiamine biosynthesis lipoprotein
VTDFRFEAMGTVVSGWIDTDNASGEGLIKAYREEVARLTAILSPWDSGSAVSCYRSGQDVAMPDELCEVIELCRWSKAITRGAFDCWGGPGGFDPSGLAKGWILEQGAKAFATVDRWWVNAGGDVLVSGVYEPVAIVNPDYRDAIACVVGVSNAVATSGESERGAHIWRSAGFQGGFAQVSVLGERLWVADMLATALFVAGKDLVGVATRLGYEAVCITSDRRLVRTAGVDRLA